MSKQLLDTGLDYLEIASKKVVHKASEFIWNKIKDTIAKLNYHKIVKPDENQKKLRK